jgi:hypothetical protein
MAFRSPILVLPALALALTIPVGASPATAASQVAPSTDSNALTVLASIPVTPEHPAGYVRTLFNIWIDADGNGCNTRQEVLISESLTPATTGSSCRILSGSWFSPYDGVTTRTASSFDIDHMVPLKEAWDSGAWAWTSAQRQAYANDLTDARTLIAVSASSNRSKGDKDPAQWLPPRATYVCSYLANWISIKARWHLSMDRAESTAISSTLVNSCSGTSIPAWPATPIAVPDAPSTTAPSGVIPQTKGTATTAPKPVTTTVLKPVPTTVPRTVPTTVPRTVPTTVPRTTTTVARPTTTTPVVTSPPVTTATGSTLPTIVPGAFCPTVGVPGIYNAKPYICAVTNAQGVPYAGGSAHWRAA